MTVMSISACRVLADCFDWAPDWILRQAKIPQALPSDKGQADSSGTLRQERLSINLFWVAD
jgi:hypothetical protein